MNYYGIDYGDQYLQHFGVPGMRWGVRKSRTPAQKAKTKARIKTALKIGAGTAAAAGAGYLAYKHRGAIQNQFNKMAGGNYWDGDTYTVRDAKVRTFGGHLGTTYRGGKPKAIRKNGLSNKQKLALAGVSAAAAIGATGGGTAYAYSKKRKKNKQR